MSNFKNMKFQYNIINPGPNICIMSWTINKKGKSIDGRSKRVGKTRREIQRKKRRKNKIIKINDSAYCVHI